MAGATDSRNYYTGGGRVYWQEKNEDGTYKPMLYLCETESIGLTIDQSFKEIDKTECSIPATGARYPEKQTAEVTLVARTVNPDTFELAFLGNKVPIDQMAESDKEIHLDGTQVKPGYTIDLGYLGCEGISVKNEDDTITYVENVDYSFEGRVGFLTILEDGQILEGDKLNVTIVNIPKIEDEGVAFLKRPEIRGRLIEIGYSQSGNSYKWIIKDIALMIDGSFDVKSSDFSTIPLKGVAYPVDNEGDWSAYIDVLPIGTPSC